VLFDAVVCVEQRPHSIDCNCGIFILGREHVATRLYFKKKRGGEHQHERAQLLILKIMNCIERQQRREGEAFMQHSRRARADIVLPSVNLYRVEAAQHSLKLRCFAVGHTHVATR